VRLRGTGPEGYFMGSKGVSPVEEPVHLVRVAAFKILRTEVTVGQYRLCVEQGHCSAPNSSTESNWNRPEYDNHPMNFVSWQEARTYCRWIGGRLPTEAAWEYAARSCGQDLNSPWGNEESSCTYAVMTVDGVDGCGTYQTRAVCSQPRGNTEHELCDMAGNVREWVEDYFHPGYVGAPDDGSAWTAPFDSRRVCRGGGASNNSTNLRTTSRQRAEASSRSPFLGFRCARDVPQDTE